MQPLSTTAFIIASIVKVVIVFTVIMLVVAGTTLAERKISAWIQDRSGPNRVGPWGLFQPIADGIKNFLKEEHAPAGAARGLFFAAPIISFFPALVLFAVIPFASPLPTRWGTVPMVIADLPIGFLYIVALASMGVYGLVLAGWSSNSKYSMLGGLRASAQMISYEVALGLSLVPILMLSGNVSLLNIVSMQQEIGLWFVLPLLCAFVFFLVSSFAETNRMPFDMPEAESELVAGYHAEYSAMKFSMFPLSEYAHIVTVSALTVTFFFGGWDIPFWSGDNMSVAAPAWWKTILTALSFSVKTGFFIFLFIWVRWTVPRFRYDQIMALGWKVMIPLLVLYIAVLGAAMMILQQAGVEFGSTFGWILAALNGVLFVTLIFWVDRGRTVPGSGWAPARRRRLEARG